MNRHLLSLAAFLVMILLAFGSMDSTSTDSASSRQVNEATESAAAEEEAAKKVDRKPAGNTIPYQVLRNVQRFDGKLIIEILVSEDASKQEVLKLAESLRREHAGKYAFVDIFDSREAWQRRDDESYPQQEFERHWLVQIGSAVGDDPQRILWLAEGRDSKPQGALHEEGADEPTHYEEDKQDGRLPPEAIQLPADVQAWIEAGEPQLTEGRLRVGEIGALNSLKVLQIIDQSTALCAYLGEFDIPGMSVMVKGVAFADTADGMRLSLPPMKVTGTVRYTTVLGASKQVYVLDALDSTNLASWRSEVQRRKAEHEREVEERNRREAWEKAWTENKRIWTDKTGGFEIEAIYAGIKPGKVILEKADQSTIEVDLKSLSNKDRLFAVQTARKRASRFVGRWRLVNEKGVTAGYFTLTSSYDARKDHAPGVTAKWEIVGNEARITWSDGWKDILRPQDGKVLKIAFKPGTGWDDPPQNTNQAIKE